MKILLFCLLVAIQANAEKYHFVSINHLVEQEVGRLVLPQIYDQLDIPITITPLPAKRAEYEASSGMKDGEIMRILAYGQNNPDMHRVATPYYSLETMVFIREDRQILINSVDDLQGYRVVKVRGVKHTDNITAGLKNLVNVNTTEQMMMFLHRGRADVAITNLNDGVVTLNKLGFSDIVTMEQPLASLQLYHYLHRDLEGLAVQVDTVIKRLKMSGELDKIIKDAEVAVLGNKL